MNKIHDDQIDEKAANLNQKIGRWFVVVVALHMISAMMN